MPGTKNRIKQVAETCRACVLEHTSSSPVGREFITDVEAAYSLGRHKPNRDEAWTHYFADQRQITKEMLERVEKALYRYEAGEEKFLEPA